MAVTAAPDAIPLYPRRRLVGTTSGGATSIRRGGRADAASSRPYRPGDHFRSIDWKASARLSSARDDDEFIVRERHAEEMPAVVIVADRRPGMALYPQELPWLHKPEALRAIAQLLIRSALNHRALVGYVDLATHPGESDAGTAFWRTPRSEASTWLPGLREGIDGWFSERFDAPDDNVALALEFLATRRSAVPLGSFLFVLSDFVVPPPDDVWSHALARGWDVVPVIVQDPVWEQSFPDIEGVLISLADADGGAAQRVRLGRRQVAERRAANEGRLARLRSDLVRLGLEPVLVGSADRDDVQAVFLDWAQTRLEVGRVG
ncbi:MAG TPA: DUF58 domain-containing protein [Gaiellaceae bacterium]|nr:DUF58 domain-containing protein [Gaiellaceae bacterium]